MATCVIRNCINPACKKEHRVYLEGQLTRYANFEYACPHCQTLNRFRSGVSSRFDDVFPRDAIVATQME